MRTLKVPVDRVEAVTIGTLPDDTCGCKIRFRAHASVLEVRLSHWELQRLVNAAPGVIQVVKDARRYADD